MSDFITETDLIVLSSHPFDSSHVRTTKVMKKFAQNTRVFYFEAPTIEDSSKGVCLIRKFDNNITVIRPRFPKNTSVFEHKELFLNLIKDIIQKNKLENYTFWTDTPKAMPVLRYLNAQIIIYDCLQEHLGLSAELEKELLQYADVVLTSGIIKAEKDFPSGEEVRI